jgi:hypothetical protein
MTVETGRTTTWLTHGQVIFRGVQLGLLGGILLGNLDTLSLLARDPRGRNMVVGALVFTAVVLGANLLSCVALNRLVPPEDEKRRARRLALTWLLEGALFPLSYLPLVLVLFIGPPVLRVIEALTPP